MAVLRNLLSDPAVSDVVYFGTRYETRHRPELWIHKALIQFRTEKHFRATNKNGCRVEVPAGQCHQPIGL